MWPHCLLEWWIEQAFEKLLQRWRYSRVWRVWIQIWNQLWLEPTCEKGSFGFFKSAKLKVSRMWSHRLFKVNEFDQVAQWESFFTYFSTFVYLLSTKPGLEHLASFGEVTGLSTRLNLDFFSLNFSKFFKFSPSQPLW